MPREIADSDEESDLGSPQRPSASPIPENTIQAPPLSTLEQDPFANLEFDQFLSPTQRLSSAVDRQDVTQSCSISSTDRFLQDIVQPGESILNSTTTNHISNGTVEHHSSAMPRSTNKRTLSDIEGGRSKSNGEDGLRKESVKRAKTYGSSNHSKADSSALFSDTADFLGPEEQDRTKERAHIDSETSSTGLPVQQLNDPDTATDSSRTREDSIIRHAQSYHPHGSTSFVQGNIQNTSVTRTSLGGYSGINMDFRGAGLSFNTNANPFGSLSQISLDADIDPSQAERFAGLFQHSHRSLGDSVPSANASEALAPGHLDEMATSPVEASEASGQRNLLEANPNVASFEDSGTHALSVAHDETSLNDVEVSEFANPPKKRRGRKPKKAQGNVNGAFLDKDDFQQSRVEVPPEVAPDQHEPHQNRSRAGTVDSVVSHVSQISEAADELNRKRKRTATDKTEDKNHKQLSSELNLSDPAMIGAPKEMYVPRPSKSRSRRVIDDEDELQQEEHTQSGRSDNPTRSENLVIDVDRTQISSDKKKNGKKNKVKRAKTSAAALLKSAEMYDEDDMDCIIVDEVPAKVKMPPLPEIGRVKQELKEDVKHQQEDKAPAEVKITIDVPKLAKPDETMRVEQPNKPKKRGRKPKQKMDTQIEAEPVEAQPDQESPNTNKNPNDGRSPLSEKDPNTINSSKSPSGAHPDLDEFTSTPPLALDKDLASISRSQTSSPKKPVHSPLKPRPILTSATSTPASGATPTSLSWIKPRVGLSRRTTIPSLLRKLDRTKEPPKLHERKEKLSKRQQEEEDRRRLEAEDAGEEYVERWAVRGKDGMLLEWDE